MQQSLTMAPTLSGEYDSQVDILVRADTRTEFLSHALAKPIPFDNLLTRLIEDSQDVILLWQLGVLAACALAAWGWCGWPSPYLEPSGLSCGLPGAQGSAGWDFRWPCCWRCCWGANRRASGCANTHLLNLAVPLLLSLVGVRLVIYALRYRVRAARIAAGCGNARPRG